MNFRSLLVLSFSVSALVSCQPAEDPAEPGQAQTPASTATNANPLELIETEGLLQRIGTLSSDEFGGRAPMSEGE